MVLLVAIFFLFIYLNNCKTPDRRLYHLDIPLQDKMSDKICTIYVKDHDCEK